MTRIVLAVICCWTVMAFAVRSNAQQESLEKRKPWTHSHFKGTPDPMPVFRSIRAFERLKFQRCIDMAQPAGMKRWFVAEQRGRIYSFRDDPNVGKMDLVADLRKSIPGLQNVYALTFHPNFSEQPFLYVCYVLGNAEPDGTHIARFRVRDTEPPTLDIQSETTILTFLSGGHNGCCLKFGPDGFLYISTGDGSGPNPPDTHRAGQDVSNLLSCILRVDVESGQDGKNYRVPADNPFVGRAGIRPEIWAYGLRNPWRMSFDRKTGDLWVGDVGWELREMLNRVQKGGNYGWSIMEGSQPTNPTWERGPTPILPPTLEHSHHESSSITDGVTYYGDRLEKLTGQHIYSDYDTGKFWAFQWQDGKAVDHREIADTTHRVVGFAEANDGEFYFLDHIGGTIHTLVANDKANQVNPDFPRRLSETGLFANVALHQLQVGVVDYSINAEPWADGATALRFIAVPGESTIDNRGSKWTFPPGTVLGKTLQMSLAESGTSLQRRLETQVLHFDGREWHPYSYRWNADGSDASLVGPEGDWIELKQSSRDAKRGSNWDPTWQPMSRWRIDSRAVCQRCHNRWAGPVLGFHSWQLERNRESMPGGESQLRWLHDYGLLTERATPNRKLEDPYDDHAELDVRARSWLHVNCAHCHRMHAGGAVLSKMHFDLDRNAMDMIGATPSQGAFGMHAARVIAPGDPERSVLYYRICKLGGGRMPHLGSQRIDDLGVRLMERWIRSLPEEQESNRAGVHAAKRVRMQQQRLLEELHNRDQSRSHEPSPQGIDRLLETTGGALMLMKEIRDGRSSESLSRAIVERAAGRSDSSIRDLFERFLPPQRRARLLGENVDPASILGLTGNSKRGERLFFDNASLRCQSCHRIGNRGTQVGPDLDGIAKRYNRAKILESILNPSRMIDPAFTSHIVETVDGRILTGILVEKNGNQVVLKDLMGKTVRVPREDIEQMRPTRKSLMPELLLRDLTAQEAADLVAFLEELKKE